MVKIILTNSYYNIFNILIEELKKEQDFIKENLVFCEDKASLMIEGMIADSMGGSFNTKVYSFGNYTRAYSKQSNLLSKEGSTMVVKKVIKGLPLCVLNRGKEIAPAVYEQISALKSAGITVYDLEYAATQTKGILKDKLLDLAKIFSAYDEYLKTNCLEDQSTTLSIFPKIIESNEQIKKTNVFVAGFSRLTCQNLDGIEKLIEKGKNFTAILPYGKNKFAFVNETATKLRDLANRLNVEVSEEYIESPDNLEGQFIIENLFCPQKESDDKIKTEKIHLYQAKDELDECEKIASIIATEVRRGKRFRDFTVVMPENYDKVTLRKAFSLFDLPVYIDTDYKVENHPLIKFIQSYLEVFVKNFQREAVFSFVKNPLFCEDKGLVDQFINYAYKYNLNYSQFKRPFTLSASLGSNLEKIEDLRQKLESCFSSFDVENLLLTEDVENKLIALSKKLNEYSFREQGAVTEQIYRKTIEIIREIKLVLSGQVTYREYKNLFQSGVSAMKLSIIPQYSDAVFVGDFKQCAYKKAKNLFVLGLNSSVPKIKEDVTLLSDNEIDRLYTLKVFIEPKIKIVNHRSREEVALGVSAFTDKLYLSYPVNSTSGERKEKSQVVSFFEKNFTLLEFEKTSNYVTKKQGVKSFSLSISKFVEWKNGDLEEATSFYQVADKEKLDKIIDSANSEFKVLLDNRSVLHDNFVSPTTLEQYYACPYKAFVSHALGVKDREEGKVGGLEIGNIMHDIFYLYLKSLGKITDENASRQVFLECAEQVLCKETYSRYLNDAQTKTQVNFALKECEKHCLNTFKFVSRSTLKPTENGLEKGFSVLLGDGKTTLYGKVDRIDENEEAYRIIDYKTGKVDESDEALYYGTKLQLYLYSLAVENKILAGVYYFDVQDEFIGKDKKREPYLKGKTLLDDKIICSQDGDFYKTGESNFLPIKIEKEKLVGASTSQTLSACVKYAKQMCENAFSQMKEGVIVASPMDGACKYCKYKSMCLTDQSLVREKKEVDDSVITLAIFGEDQNA
ncbi:MAG: PD-(D/E)XK nuclease family protein [Clostridia bacterium]|nr:PD-(D/E)XK nuclease family protein [Clostridia bacterium]